MEHENDSHLCLTDALAGDLEPNGKQHVNGCLMVNVSLVPLESYKPIISDDVMWYLDLYISVILSGVICAFGSLSNVVNVILFYKLGIRMSMDVYLSALSVSDFILCMAATVSIAYPIFAMFFFSFAALPRMAQWTYPFALIVEGSCLCSGWVTAILAIERCVCVVFPFKVKQIFTLKRSIVVVVMIFIITHVQHIPLFFTIWLEWVDIKEELGNKTILSRRHVLVFSDNRQEIARIVDIVALNFLSLTSLGLILGSVFWMMYGLQISSRKRAAMTAKSTESDGSIATYKSRRLSKAVLYIAIIHTMSCVPRLAATYMNREHPEMRDGGMEMNLNNLLWRISRIASAINASVNIFVYLKINSNYFQKFKEVFLCDSSRSK